MCSHSSIIISLVKGESILLMQTSNTFEIKNNIENKLSRDVYRFAHLQRIRT